MLKCPRCYGNLSQNITISREEHNVNSGYLPNCNFPPRGSRWKAPIAMPSLIERICWLVVCASNKEQSKRLLANDC